MSIGRALVAAYTVPEADRDSGSKRIAAHVDLLLEAGYEVTFVSTQPPAQGRHLRELRQRGVPVFHATDAQVEELLRAAPFDVALLAFWPTAELLLPLIRRISPATRVIVDSVDLHLLRHARRIFTAVGRERLLDARFGDQVIGELNAYAAADAVLTVSAKEAALIGDLVNEPDLAHVVPDNEELALSPRPYAARRGMVFVGSFRHAPNVDAVAFLCKEIVPRLPAGLLAEHPVIIVGDALDDRIVAYGLGRRTIRMVGWVPRLEPYFESARICVLPLLSGAGTKRKLIQALMLGTPIVGTSIAAEGVDLRDGRDILIADDPDAFAAAIERLVGDQTLWTSVRRSGRERVLGSHGRDIARSALLGVVAHVLSRPAKRGVLQPIDGERHHDRLLYQWQLSLIESGERHSLGESDRSPRHSLLDRARVLTGRGSHGNGRTSIVAPTTPVEHGVTTESPSGAADEPVRVVAFYLPQFHPIPENDAWWGEGFTEWTNVRAGEALFTGHDQPRVPGELGYYDLLDPAIRGRQAALAREHGIDAFCYYHYWFQGKRLLERPFTEILRSGEPDHPFLLCWANEPWSRRWDGSDKHVLQAQAYDREDDLAHIRALLPALADPRAVKVGGKSVFIVYRAWELPEPEVTTDIWRSELARVGLPGLHLLAVETGWDEGWDATGVGFDAKIRFQPQFNVLRTAPRVEVPDHPDLHVYDYGTAWPLLNDLLPAAYPTIETVFPSWDNTARRGAAGYVVHGSEPDAFRDWLRLAMERAAQRPPEERFVFINAWNEWAEGAYLEPDERHGRGYLEAVRDAKSSAVGRPQGARRSRRSTPIAR